MKLADVSAVIIEGEILNYNETPRFQGMKSS